MRATSSTGVPSSRPRAPAPLATRATFLGCCDEAPPARLTNRLVEKSRREARLDAVCEGTERGRDRHGAKARALPLTDVGEMEDEACGYPEAATPPRGRHRQMDPAGECVREIVERECRLVGEYSRLLAPQPGDDEVFVVARREVDEAIDPPANAQHLLVTKIGEELGRIAGSSRLPRGEVAGLRLGNAEERVPVGRLAWCLFTPGRRAPESSQTLVSCNTPWRP